MNDRPQPGVSFKRTLAVDGRDRWYSGHVTEQWDGASPLPLIVAIHGATSNPRLMERFSGLSDKADQAGFLVVYPAGTGNLPNVLTWNGGICCGYAVKHQIDDVAWLDRMLDDALGWLPVDPERIYFAGMSNGAHMTYRYAAERPQRLAAIACVGGPMAAPFPTTLSKPVPLIHIHGVDDEFAAYEGGRGPKSLFAEGLPSVAETIAAWVRANGLADEPRFEAFPDAVGDGTSIERRLWGPNSAGAEVILYTIIGGGHTWPGQPPLPLSLGKSSANMNANDAIWAFFERHRRSGRGSG